MSSHGNGLDQWEAEEVPCEVVRVISLIAFDRADGLFIFLRSQSLFLCGQLAHHDIDCSDLG